MQTIKCVVVGDGAVGKVCILGPINESVTLYSLPTYQPDLSPNFIHDEQIPQRIRSDGKLWSSTGRGAENFQAVYAGI
jgi:GTPase SAR1 family protein